jgi:hypothetical protein
MRWTAAGSTGESPKQAQTRLKGWVPLSQRETRGEIHGAVNEFRPCVQKRRSERRKNSHM